jgi:cellulose synthase/poly-beta-1,6-N-acetylglucosamine synthase-like glycosyltransferase
MSTFILSCHFGLLTLLCAYGWHRLHITRLYWANAQCLMWPTLVAGDPFAGDPPTVTVQLPIYNEKFVVERLIDAAAAIRYPWDKLEIQVLDDSSDETVDLARARVETHRRRGCPIEHLRRVERNGFKAGALAWGLERARGEFVAIFDADFVPDPRVLEQSVRHFHDQRLGMIQTRWEHLNRNYSAFTQVQAIWLDAHFTVEHGARCASGLFFNFNGTAGIWRVATIRDSGGWQWDTLTEDLDLSYRAQLRGWRFLFLPTLSSPGELPTEMSAFKSQQYRWAKGATQVMRKLLPQVWSRSLPLRTRVEATFHLTSNFAYLIMVIDSVFFLAPSVIIRHSLGWHPIFWIDVPIFFFASLCHLLFFAVGQRAIFGSLKGRLRYVPALMSFGIGLGINNARAVVDALLGRESDFVRTPKRGEAALGARSAWQLLGAAYRIEPRGWEYLELGLGLSYAFCLAWAGIHRIWAALPILLLFQNGFLLTGLYGLLERRRR